MSRRGVGEGSIRQRKDGTFEARPVIDGERSSFYARTMREMQHKLSEAKRLAERGKTVGARCFSPRRSPGTAGSPSMLGSSVASRPARWTPSCWTTPAITPCSGRPGPRGGTPMMTLDISVRVSLEDVPPDGQST